jgi:predicted nucleotidyltransferase
MSATGTDPRHAGHPARDTTKLGLSRVMERDFQEFCSGLITSYQNLRSIIVYGSLARGEYIPERSDINVLVVVESTELETLRAGLRVIRKGRERCRTTPLFVTHEDMVTSADVFPIYMNDMRDAYIVVHGEDILAGLVVSDANLRLQVEQELKMLMLNIREFFLQRAHMSGPSGSDVLLGYFSKLLHLLKQLCRLRGLAAPKRMEDLIAISAAELGLETKKITLFRMAEFKRGKEMKDACAEAATLYSAVAKAADYADKLVVQGS